jgi:ribulose-5-phosphate 4-epimerase/fuculose-1-phosphate aldolase
MFDKKSSITNFQTFYVSNEESNCPLIPEIVKIGKKFFELDLSKKINETVVSLRYGRRILINTDYANFKELEQADFLEIVDYDPLKKVLLVMGNKEPRVETPIHWLIHHARDEVNAVIQINDVKLIEQLRRKIPVTEKEYPSGTLEQAKEILKGLRNSKRIVIKNQGILFVGNSIKEVEDEALKTFKELK